MKKRESRSLREVTPANMRCPPFGACPSIFVTPDDTYIVVGKLVDASNLATLRARLGKGEIAIEVPRPLLDRLSR